MFGIFMKAQVSTELLVIIAVVLVIFIPLMVLVYMQASNSNAKIAEYQAELAVFRLAYQANSVGALGSNTDIIAEVYIPPGVKEIRIKNTGKGAELLFVIQTPLGDSEKVEVLKYPLVKEFKLSGNNAGPGWVRFTITSVYENEVAKLKMESSRPFEDATK